MEGKAKLVRTYPKKPYYMTQYIYECIDCGEEFSRCRYDKRINPYCGACAKKHEYEKAKERAQKKKTEEIVRELELLYKDIHNFLYPLIKENWILETVDKICEKHIENIKRGESNVL